MKLLYTLTSLVLLLNIWQEQCCRADDGRIILSPGISVQGQLFGEINIMYHRYIGGHGGTAFAGPRIGLETNFRTDRFIYAPKLGYEVSGLPLALRASTIAYVDKGDIDVRLLPEIGLSAFSIINLTYGYSFPILNFKAADISNHKISLTVNLHPDLWK